jgi:hypothetical protein
VLLSMNETMAADNSRRAAAALYAAEAGIERVLPDLWHLGDWNAALDGSARSGFLDGPPAGERVLEGGRRIDIDEVVNLANCGQTTRCSDAAMNAVTSDRPWGADNPRWRPFAYGPIASLCVHDGVPPPGEYVVVLVADDPAERDGDPLRDGRPGTSPGAGLLLVRAEAFAADGTHRVVEATVARGQPGQSGEGYAAQHGQGTAQPGAPGVGTPGGSLQRAEMTLSGEMVRK